MNDQISSFLTSKEKSAKTVKKTTLTSEDVNAAIALADDGNTIIFCDYPFKEPPQVIVLDLYNKQAHVAGGDFGTPGVCLHYPLEYDKINIWKSKEMTYFAYVDEKGAEDVFEVPIFFVNG